MDNPETLATLDTPDIGRRQKKSTTQHTKLKRWIARTPPNTGSDPKCSGRLNGSCIL